MEYSMKHIRIAMFTLFLFATTGVGLAEASQNVSLVYFGNLNGELEPCGCAEESNLGGIRRQAYIVGEWRKKHPELVLISTGGLLTSEIASDRTKSEYIVKGISAMNFDAVGIQWRDLAYGNEFLRVAPVPWVSSNSQKTGFSASQTVQRKNLQIAVLSWLEPGDAGAMAMMESAPEVSPAAVQKKLSDAKTKGMLTVLMTTLPLADAEKQFKLSDVDVLLVRPVDENYATPRLKNGTLILQPGTRGMRIGSVDLTLNEKHKVTKFEPTVMKLPADVPDAPELDGWYKDYTAALKEDYLRRVEIRKTLNEGNTDFVGAEGCQSCHAKEHEIWGGTQHSHAFEKLEAVGKIFDPNCVGCHSVGYDKPGGYIDPSLTAGLQGVQCENCHGAGRAHVESGGTKPLPNKDWEPVRMCGQCHVGSHSPSFAFDKYWPKIKHEKQ